MSAITFPGVMPHTSAAGFSKPENDLPIPEKLFDENVRKEKCCIGKVLSKIVARILDAENMSFVNSVLGEARAVYGLVKTFFKSLISVSRIFAATEFSKVFSIPFDVFGLVLGAYDFIVEHGEERIDAFLGILGSISEIGDASSSVAAMLVDLGALGASTMNWALPLNIASSILSAVFIVMSVRSLYFSAKTVKALNQKLNKPEVPDYDGAYEVFKKHKYSLERHCEVDFRLVQKKIREVYKAQRLGTIDEPEFDARMKKVFRSLKGRIYQKQFSHALGILITKMGIVATLCFALSPFFAPLSIVGFSLLAILFASSLFKMGFNFYANTRLKVAIRSVPA